MKKLFKQLFAKQNWKLFISGLLAGLSFAPFHLIIFLPISYYYLINFILKYDRIDKKILLSIYCYGLIFSFGFYLVQLYWISFSLFVDIKQYFWLFPFAISLIPFANACFLAISITLFYYLIKKLNIQNKFLITIVFALIFTFIDIIKSILFPWTLMGYVIGFSDILIQLSYIFNIYIISFFVVFISCFSYVLFEYKNNKLYFIKSNKYYFIFYILFISASIIFGVIRLKYANIKYFDINIRLVQANISQKDKMNIDNFNNIIQQYIDLSNTANYNNIDLLIWAENSYPYAILDMQNIPYQLKELKISSLITGAVRVELNQNSEISNIWNSIMIYDNNKLISYYDKIHLVPFGEFIPFSKYFPFISKITGGIMDFSKGISNKTIEINNIKISPIICYEIAFPNSIIDKNNKPDIIVNLTNDGWFGKSSGPYQHLIFAKFRAVENKIPIIRVSNSGITAVIDEYGRIVNQIPLDTVNILDIKI